MYSEIKVNIIIYTWCYLQVYFTLVYPVYQEIKVNIIIYTWYYLQVYFTLVYPVYPEIKCEIKEEISNHEGSCKLRAGQTRGSRQVTFIRLIETTVHTVFAVQSLDVYLFSYSF